MSTTAELPRVAAFTAAARVERGAKFRSNRLTFAADLFAVQFTANGIPVPCRTHAPPTFPGTLQVPGAGTNPGLPFPQLQIGTPRKLHTLPYGKVAPL